MQRLGVILRFVRFPLVWTALGDVLAAAVITRPSPEGIPWQRLAPVLLISPALYLFGMGINDLVDIGEDRRAGRDRPLAKNELAAGSATLITVFLLGVAMIGAAYVNRAALKMIAVTLGAIAIYNIAAKRWLPTAIVFMTACRVGNLLIGWGAATGNWRFDLQEQATYGWVLVASVSALTALASLVSGLEKRLALRSLFGVRPSTLVLGCLLLLPVANAVSVIIAWGGSPWGLLWLGGVPLALASSAVVRRLAAPRGSPDRAAEEH